MHRLYLPGLNGIRAIAALMVVIAHFGQLFAKEMGFTFTTYLSNQYIESYFLKKKSLLAKIKNRNLFMKK
jgi:hypothetical protein